MKNNNMVKWPFLLYKTLFIKPIKIKDRPKLNTNLFNLLLTSKRLKFLKYLIRINLKIHRRNNEDIRKSVAEWIKGLYAQSVSNIFEFFKHHAAYAQYQIRTQFVEEHVEFFNWILNHRQLYCRNGQIHHASYEATSKRDSYWTHQTTPEEGATH